jgi:hypothetical protein
MSAETYTPGHTRNATDFMARRTLQSHGEFLAGQLARQLEEKEEHGHAQTLRAWGQSERGLFAQSWVSAVGTK